MAESLLKRIAIQSVTVMLLVITLSYTIQRYQLITIEASDKLINNTMENLSPNTYLSSEDAIEELSNQSTNDDHTLFQGVMEDVDVNIISHLSDRYLIIKKPEGSALSLTLEDLYLTRSIRININGLSNDDISSGMIGRVHNDELFTGEPDFIEYTTFKTDTTDDVTEPVITKDYGNDIIHGITIDTLYDEEQEKYRAEIMLELDNVYVHNLQEDDNFYYIDLNFPRDVYDKILVIDAGHGGKDAGALSKDEKYYEKDFNLDILLHLKEKLDQEDIKVYYTRLSDEKLFLRPRVNLANAVDCDFFISIHCNASTASGPNGTEILYYDREFEGIKSKDLAQIISTELGKTISIKNRGLVQKKDNEIFILKNAIVPAIIIEVGYLTNNNDMIYLSNSEHRKAAAEGIYNGIMTAYETLKMKD
ncbi:MAG: N-acetylmuramoyl-L-alanine amidase [Clostridiales bacterium]|nr:N-acetylmuramoyl-L-alanine amidase [Clostridiales bacterium]